MSCFLFWHQYEEDSRYLETFRKTLDGYLFRSGLRTKILLKCSKCGKFKMKIFEGNFTSNVGLDEELDEDEIEE